MTSDYKEKLLAGEQYQDWVIEKLYDNGLPIISYSSKKYQFEVGENKAGLEIKFDRNWITTGNLYIEIAEKSNPNNANYILSGIYRTDNTWLYLIGDYTRIFIFSKKFLKIIHKRKKYKEVTTCTSKGYLLPVKDAEEFYAIKIIQGEN